MLDVTLRCHEMHEFNIHSCLNYVMCKVLYVVHLCIFILQVTSFGLVYFESIGFYLHPMAMTCDLTVGQNINRVRNLESVLFHAILFKLNFLKLHSYGIAS